jgi:hypothetical protein
MYAAAAGATSTVATYGAARAEHAGASRTADTAAAATPAG